MGGRNCIIKVRHVILSPGCGCFLVVGRSSSISVTLNCVFELCHLCDGISADPGGKLEKEVELRQAAEERAATAEHQFSLLQLELKKSKSELQMMEDNLSSQQAMVSPSLICSKVTPTFVQS